jgi:tripartite-type tricarboxylate transporter receptor subunit TctC
MTRTALLAGGRRITGTLALAACLSFGGAALCRADAVADFYHGKIVRVVIGFEVGGGYDIFARAIAPYLGKYLPGNPTFVAQNMAGAGSRLATNWMYNVAPHDGTVIAMVSQGTPMDQATKQPGVQFKAENFGWIGNAAVDNLTVAAWAPSGLKTLDDVRAKGGLICGGTGGTTPTMIYPRILNALLGTKIRIVSGYSGSSGYALAMEQGELNCVGAASWSTLTSSMARFIQDRQLNMLVQIGPSKEPEVSDYAQRDVPLITEFAKTAVDRDALELINSGITVGRPLFAPPDIPPDRLKALRDAFDATMKDPSFLADSKKLGLIINPISGDVLQQAVSKVTSASPEILKRVDELISPGSDELQSNK